LKKRMFVLTAILLMCAFAACAEGVCIGQTNYDEFLEMYPGIQPDYCYPYSIKTGFTQDNGVYLEARFEFIGDDIYLTDIGLPYGGSVEGFTAAADPACVADIVVGSTTREQVQNMPGVYYAEEKQGLENESGYFDIYEGGLCWRVRWDEYGDRQLVDSVSLRFILPGAAEARGMRGGESIDDFDDVVILKSTLEEVTAAHPDYWLAGHVEGYTGIICRLDDCSMIIYSFEEYGGEMVLTSAGYIEYRDIFAQDDAEYVYEDRVLTGKKDPDDFSMVHVGKTTYNELGAEYRNHMQMETSQKMFYLDNTQGETLQLFFHEGPGYGVVTRAYVFGCSTWANSGIVNIVMSDEELAALTDYLETNEIGY